MNNFAKRAGIITATGVAASALFVGGFVAPANASEAPNGDHWVPRSTSVSNDQSTTSTSVDLLRELSTSVPILLQPRDNSLISGGLINTGDVASGTQVGDVASSNPIASGNSTANGNDVPVASGNDAPIASGNETSAGNGNSTPIGSGNDTSAPIGSGDDVTAPVGSGNDTSTDLSDIGANVSDSVNSTVDDALQGVTGDLGLGAVLGR